MAAIVSNSSAIPTSAKPAMAMRVNMIALMLNDQSFRLCPALGRDKPVSLDRIVRPNIFGHRFSRFKR